MGNNSFGTIFQVTTFGESHGTAVGAIIDGCPAGLNITLEYIQAIVNERKSANSPYTTKRHEPDLVEITSGIYQDKTLGTPISLIIKNKKQKSTDYNDLTNIYRPSHADFTWDKKFFHTDPRGGGRASARETVARVAASAFAYKILEKYNVKIYGFLSQIGCLAINPHEIDYNYINKNSLFSATKNIIPQWEKILTEAIDTGDSLGAILEIHITDCPIGLGEPVFNKLNAKLAQGIFSIPAVKGLEFGNGFFMASQQGSAVNDAMRVQNKKPKFINNYSAGINGGISNGENIILRIAIKPTSSISKTQTTLDKQMNTVNINIKGRHDPCIGIRAIAVCKAMCAITLADFILQKNNNTI